MSIYYTEKQQQPEFSMKDIISILGESADFDYLKLHICVDIEKTASTAAEEAGLEFSNFKIDLSSAMQYIQNNDNRSEELEGILYRWNDILYDYRIHTAISFQGPSWAVYCVCLRINRQDEDSIEYYSKMLNSWQSYEFPYNSEELDDEYERILTSGTAESDFLGCILDNFGSIPPEKYIMLREAYSHLLELYQDVKEFMQFTLLPVLEISTDDDLVCRIALEPKNPLISGLAISEDEGLFTLHELIRPGHGDASPFDSLNKRLTYERNANCCFYKEISQTDSRNIVVDLLRAAADRYTENMVYRVPLSFDFYTEAFSVPDLGCTIKPFNKNLKRELNETETKNNEKIAEFAAIAAMEMEDIA